MPRRSIHAPRLRRIARFTAHAAALLLAACEGSCSNVVAPGKNDSFAIESRDTLTARIGETATGTIRLTRISSPDRQVRLLTAARSALAATYAPSTLTSTQTSSTISVPLPEGTPLGLSSVLVDAEMPTAVSSVTVRLDTPLPVYVRVLEASGFTATVSPNTLRLLRGDTAVATLAVTRTGGFTGAINASVSGLPSGVTATVTPFGSGDRATLLLRAAPTATLGNATATVTLSAPGTATRTVTVALTVDDPPGYTFTAGVASQTVAQGTTGAPVTLNVARRGGYAGEVTVSVAGLPAGVTAAVTSPGTGNAGTVAFTAVAQVPPGTYSLTLIARAAGLPDQQQLPFSLVVVVPPSYDLSLWPGAVTVYRGGAARPVAVTLTRSGGYAGAVTLSLSGLPARLTAAVTDPGTGNAGEIRYTADSLAADGTYPVTVTARSAELADRVVTVPVTIAPMSLSLSATPSITLPRGGSAGVGVTITRLGEWTGDVSLSVSIGGNENGWAPDGISVRMAPTTTSGTSSSVIVNVAGSATVGTFPITVRATGPGGMTAVVVVVLKVPT